MRMSKITVRLRSSRSLAWLEPTLHMATLEVLAVDVGMAKQGRSGLRITGGAFSNSTPPRNVSYLPSPSPKSFPESLGEKNWGTESLTSFLDDSDIANMSENMAEEVQ